MYDEFKDLVITYTTKTFTLGEDIAVLVRELLDPTTALEADQKLSRPTKISDTYDEFEIEEWKQKNRNYLTRKDTMKSNCKKLYGFV